MRIAMLLVGILLCAPTMADAQSPPPPTNPAIEARGHFDRGMTLLDAENFDGAIAEFQRSYELSPRVSVLYNISVAQQALRRYPDAAHTLELYLSESATTLTPARRAEVQHTLDSLRTLIARIRVVVAQPGLTVRIDGFNVGRSPLAEPVEVGPGRHTVEVLTNGLAVGRADVTVASGGTSEVHLTAGDVEVVGALGVAPSLRFAGTPARARVTIDEVPVDVGSESRVAPGVHTIYIRAPGYLDWTGSVTVTWGQVRVVNARLARIDHRLGMGFLVVGSAATVALVIAGTIAGILTLQTHDQYIALRASDPSAPDVQARGELLRGVTNGLFVTAGVVGIATAVVLTQTRLIPPRSEATIAVAPMPGGAFAMASVHF